MTVARLLAADAGEVGAVFLADAATMTGDGYPLLAVDLDTEPGLTFRVPARRFAEVADNLSIGNMDFADFAEAADETGTFRGFEE